MINASNEVKCPLLREFWIYNFSWIILGRVFIGSIVNIRNKCLFFWVHVWMNWSAKQTNRPRTASWLAQFVCPALWLILPWTQKKLEWGCPNGTKYPPRQPIQTPQVMCLKPFYLTAQFYLTACVYRQTDGRTDRVIPVYPPPPNFVVGVIKTLVP